MLNQCSSALLLSGVESFSNSYKELASSCDVTMRVEAEWKSAYRVNEDVIICGGKYADCINRAYYPKTVIILGKSESFMPYAKKGFSRFIFDYTNQTELVFAFMKEDKILVHTDSKDIVQIMKNAEMTSFVFGDYEFLFDKNRFSYKGRPIYLAESHKKYLAEWLLNGHKDNKKRMIICNLRKKFGADFLKDVDRFGQIKEEKKC